ncbi:hypothetical protein HYU06_02245 [Candidatus Woesearchaeota archaeon]|nr:hypothetical protein [Candidatus Woesearchaeota archaeon]
MKLKSVIFAIIQAALFSILFTLSVTASEVSKIEGDGFTLFYSTVKDRIAANEEAVFKIQVKEDITTIERFRVKEFSTEWDFRTDPTYVQYSGQVLYPDELKEFTLYLKPEPNIKFGQHEVVMETQLENYKTASLPLYVYVEPVKEQKQLYAVDLDIQTEAPAAFDPRQDFAVKFTLTNLNKRDLPKIVFNIQSKLIKETITTSLTSLEKNKVVELKKQFDPKLKPQEDELVITVTVDNEVVKTIRRTISIVDYSDKFSERREEKNGILKITKTIIKNIDGKRYFAWDIALKPGDSSDPIIVTTSYRSFVFFVVLFFAALVFYYLQKSPIIVTKHGVAIEKTEDGITEVKISVSIKNNSNITFDNLTVTDTVPSIASVVQDSGFGPVKPNKILTSKKTGNVLVKWELESLGPGEDKILSYKIKPKLSILGSFDLQAATVRYPSGDKSVRVESNRVTVMG